MNRGIWGIFLKTLSHEVCFRLSKIEKKMKLKVSSLISLAPQFSPFFKIIFRFLHLLTPCNQAAYPGYITLLTFYFRFYQSSTVKPEQTETKRTTERTEDVTTTSGKTTSDHGLGRRTGSEAELGGQRSNPRKFVV